MRTGRYIESDQLNRDIDRIKQMIDEADAYEESCKPKPVIDIVGEEELHKSGIIPLMIECHLIADFLIEVSYMVKDKCKELGLTGLKFTDELEYILQKSNIFAEELITLCPEDGKILLRNETFNASLHKKYMKYMEQRLKNNSKQSNNQ